MQQQKKSVKTHKKLFLVAIERASEGTTGRQQSIIRLPEANNGTSYHDHE